jgi:hypothetical protein
MSAMSETPAYARIKPDRRQTSDAERIAALHEARRQFVEALSKFQHAKATLERLIAESGS